MFLAAVQPIDTKDAIECADHRRGDDDLVDARLDAGGRGRGGRHRPGGNSGAAALAAIGALTSRIEASAPAAPFRRTASFTSPVSTTSSSQELLSMAFRISAISS
jgi:hypothetical protein